MPRVLKGYSKTIYIVQFLKIKPRASLLHDDRRMSVEMRFGTREVVDRQISAMDNEGVGPECYFMLALTF